MKRRAVVLSLFAAALVCVLAAPSVSFASPWPSNPVPGSYVSRYGEVFQWGDDSLQDLQCWRIEISTSPVTDSLYTGYPARDYLQFGNFASGVVLRRDVSEWTVDLGGALAPGTYYWHVGSFYKYAGATTVYWSEVRSFTVYDPAAPAPRICVSPTSLTFSALQGTIGSLPEQSLRISNSGSGAFAFASSTPAEVPWVALGVLHADGSLKVLPVQVDPTDKTPGTYETSVTIADSGSSPAASVSTVTVPVTLRVYAAESVPPAGCTIAIDNGAVATSQSIVALKLAASDAGSGVGAVRFDQGDGVWSTWATYTQNKQAIVTASSGTKAVRAQFRDLLGNVSAIVSDTIVLDTVPANRAAVWAPYYTSSVSKNASFPVKFTATDSGPAGMQGYEVSYRLKPATSWTRWGRVNASSATWRGLPGRTYQFKATSIDKAGNPAVQASVVVDANVPYDQTAGVYSSRWSVLGQTSAFLGSVRTTTKVASVSFRVTGKNFLLLATKGPKRSRARVFVDGVYVKTIDTRSASSLYRQAIALKSFSLSGAHTIKIVNAPSSGRARLDVDGLIATK